MALPGLPLCSSYSDLCNVMIKNPSSGISQRVSGILSFPGGRRGHSPCPTGLELVLVFMAWWFDINRAPPKASFATKHFMWASGFI